MAQLNLYYQTQLSGKVTLLPEQQNSDIEQNLLHNLREKLEGRINEVSYIVRVNRIIDFGYGEIDSFGLKAMTNYNVKYDCLICAPVKKMEVIVQVHSHPNQMILSKNGPLSVVTYEYQIDENKFTKASDSNKFVVKETGDEIQEGDFVKVVILNTIITGGHNAIYATARLIDMATPEEIEEYHQEQLLLLNKEIDNEIFI